MDDTQQFISALIRRKARQLVGKASITILDTEDIEQDLQVDLLERMPKFDASKTSLCRFSKKIIRNRISKLLRERLAKKRGIGRTVGSVNEMIVDGAGRMVEVAETIPDPRASNDKTAELRIRVREIFDRLPSDLRELCRLLTAMSVSEAAEVLKTDRANLYRRIRALRAIFQEEGFDQIDLSSRDTFGSQNG